MNITYPISENYVKHWNTYDALREIFQNGMDANKAGFPLYWHYDYENEILVAENIGTTISDKSFLLGESDKSSGSIGQFGEGLKIALLVLAREGHEVYMTNNGMYHQVYLDTMYEDAKVLRIEEIAPDKDNIICFQMHGITKKMMSKYTRLNLYMQNYRSIDTSKGEILKDARHMGQVFVGGLYITSINNLTYGYNFDPGVLPIDRDRKRVASFDVGFVIKDMLAEAVENNSISEEQFYEMLEAENLDTNYIEYAMNDRTWMADKVYELFEEKAGDKIPVYAQSEADELRDQYENVDVSYVPHHLYEVLVKSSIYSAKKSELVAREKITPQEACVKFYEDYEDLFPLKLKDAFFAEIIEPAESW